ncbi:MAG: sigma-70 family RNA polymerase sigma factor [Acidobacteria bacterium]|nr:MAG: sigma-70 family RNA polymerase sigma factor [Acidobacteriota bacterium]
MAASAFSSGRDEVADLVIAAQKGDRAAFDQLYRAYARMVHGVLLTRIPRSDVEDLVQDVFIQAMQRLGSLRSPEAFGGWLAAIARTRAIDHLRRLPPTTELVDDVAANEPDRSELMTVLAAIERLPLAYRETLVLRFVEGMTGQEISAKTGLTEGSVRVNLHRGMKQLKEEMERGRR